VADYWCERAWLDGGVLPGLVVEHSDGVITGVTPGSRPPPGAHRLPGLAFAGMADAHSHAFHRALRGRTAAGGGTFWGWRQAMYSLAGRLDAERYLDLATAAYAELVCAGWTAVGEFHYLPELTGAVREAAARVGIRLVLLETLYLTGGIGRPLDGVQRRFEAGGFDGWATRLGAAGGAAVHSVRAVPPDALHRVASALGPDRPLHVHLSEQPAENADCRAAYGRTPTELLADAGLLGPRTTAVHATHLTSTDIALLGGSGTGVCVCPSTEADLADGLGPARELADAGCPISLGSDAHVLADPFAEARGLEYGARLRSGTRGRFTPRELVEALTAAGHRSLGLPGGRIEPGAPCDLVAVRTDSARTAGGDPAQAVLTGSAADVHTVVVGGSVVAADGVHAALGPPGPLLAAAVAAAWK
jgi:formiminoglutamate deiminase